MFVVSLWALLKPMSWLRHSVIWWLNKGQLEANVSHLRLQNILKMSSCCVAGGQNQRSDGCNSDLVNSKENTRNKAKRNVDASITRKLATCITFHTL